MGIRQLFNLGALCGVLFLSACGKDVVLQGGMRGGAYEIDKSVPDWQAKLFASDLSAVAGIHLSSPPSESERQKFNIPNFSGQSLAVWLNARVKYIIGESVDWTKIANGTDITSLRPTAFADSNIVTLMENTGAGMYRSGKASSQIYSLPINGKSIEARSTRVGIVRIGEGLFQVNKFKGSYNNRVSSWLRISTFIHEARHSDGNGTNAGFPHAKCTEGTYKDHYSCEMNTNGPYAIESIFLYSLYNSCKDCSGEELEALLLSAYDAKSRLQDSAKYSDPRPERF